MIIGVTGTKASGKGNIVRALAGQGFRTFSFGDICRKKAANMFGEVYSASQLQDAGDKLREEGGSGALAKIMLEQPGILNSNWVIDGIRNPGEIEVLRKLSDFYLVATDAPRPKRFERLKARRRSGDPQDYQGFIELDQRDLRDDRNPNGQQVADCIFNADYHFNADFPTQEQAVDEFISGKSGLMNLIKTKNPRRPSFDELFMREAYEIARRSTCLRRRVGAVIALGNRSIAAGYNAPPMGFKHCEEVGCVREREHVPSGERAELCRAIHAEENALLQLVRHGPSPVGGTLYTTTYPCTPCAKSALNALTPGEDMPTTRQARIVIWTPYTDQHAEKILGEQSTVKIQSYTGISPKVYPKFFG